MPRAYPSYPYIEPTPIGITDAEINYAVSSLRADYPDVSIPESRRLDSICHLLGVEVEYSAPPYDIMLDVPLDTKPVIWLPKHGRDRMDRLISATALGHWILHVPSLRAAHPNHGIQALYSPSNAEARDEAHRYALTLLMPSDRFLELWADGRAPLVSDVLNVPTEAVYRRAQMLLSQAELSEQTAD